MKNYNIFWILIDSARNHQTDEDDRGLPQSVVDFAKQNIHYKNVVTSAPSTIQSISSMLTSTPSYLLSRSYNNYRGNDDGLVYFPHILKNIGYNIFGAIYFKHGREVMSHVFDIIEKKYLPYGLKHRKEVWNNGDVYQLFKKFLNKNNWLKPTMCYLHYNVRVDSNISAIIDKTLKKIQEYDLMNNSIIIINSDHGYPSISRNWNPDKAKIDGWGHDQQLFNDNILTPLVLKYPNANYGEINEYVSTLDIVPTICDILSIKTPPNYYGISLISNKISHKRLLRTDNRYIGQTPANTSYIYNNKKCIIYSDKNNKKEFEYYDLIKDPLENFPEKFNDSFDELLEKIKDNENEYNNYHFNLLFQKWSAIKKIKQNGGIKRICVVQESSIPFENLTINVLRKIFQNSEIVHIRNNDYKKSKLKYDLIIKLIESELPWDLKKLNDISKDIQGSKIIYLDNNGKIYYNFVRIRILIKFFKNRLLLFKQDKLFLIELFLRVINKRILRPVK